MCPNCDGRIAYDATQCPYCFATLQVPLDTNQGSLFSLQDSLYAPPYKSVTPTPEEKKPMPPASRAEAAILTPEAAEETTEVKAFWPILLLTLGINLFTFGLLQFFFSDNGIVKLEISSSFWFLYMLVSIPLFYLGFKKAEHLK